MANDQARRGLVNKAFAIAAVAAAAWAPAVQAVPFQGGPDGHFYQAVAGQFPVWQNAEAAAAAMTFLGVAGHLVTITSAAEQSFVTSLGFNHVWIGGEETGGANSNVFSWITGEAFVFTNWSSGEPSNQRDEPYIEMFSTGVWNDNVNNDTFVGNNGFVVEFDVPEPGSLALLGLGLAGLGFGGRKRAG